jgi:DNA mismatch endonuclease (patch repair protein)
MSDIKTHAQRSYNMSRIRSKNTTPERIVRKELWRRGYRYRLNDRRLPGTPDLVLPKYRAVIFINGCFWHGHRDCPKYVAPKNNAQFWKEKIARNIARDELNALRLDTLSWTVITVWECEVSKKADLSTTIARIEADLQAAKTKYEHYLSIRRENREFARKQAQKHREILAQVEAELNLPKSLRRYTGW